VRIVKSRRLQEYSDEQGTGSIDLSPAIEWCRNRQVPILISASIEQKEDSFLVVTNVFDVETGKSLYKEQIPYADKEGIFEVVDEVSKEIKANPKIVPQGEEELDLAISLLMSNSFDALLDYYTGKNAYMSGDTETGIRKVHNAVKLDSSFVIALHCLALNYDHRHDSRRAIEYAQRASKLVEGMGPEQETFSYFIECTVKKEWHKANNYLNTLLKIKPDKSIDWYLRKGYITVNHIKNYKETISNLEKAIELDPMNLSGRLGECYNFLGYAYLFSGQTIKAYEAFDKYQAWTGPTPDPLHTKGSAFQFSGQYERAIEQYEKVIREDPSYHMCYKDLGWTYLELGKCREALRNFEKYIEILGKSDPYGHVLLGRFYYIQEDASMAESEVSKALELDSLSIQAHWLQGLISLELNDDIESARKELLTLKILTKDLGVSGETAYYHHLRGLILLSTSDIDGGLKSLREAEGISPADFTYFGKELVQGYYAAGLYRDAIMKADSLLNIYFVERNNGELQYLLGLAYQEENKREEANHCYQKAQQIWKDADTDFRPLKRLISKLEESL
jgi:tetratricopeptide (TPR) repeat protein